MSEKTTSIQSTTSNLSASTSSHSPEQQFYLRQLYDGNLNAGIWHLFPLSEERLARFCSHCQILAMPFPLNALTGEEARLGLFYRQRLLHECRWIIPEPLNFDDYPILCQRAAFFQMNQVQFQCPSIGLALAVIIKSCEQFNAAMQRRSGEDQW